MSALPPTKKPKISGSEPSSNDNPNSIGKQSRTPATCHLFRLPNEIIAELLSWIDHPLDVLSLARTSKLFCNKLVDPSATYIWRRAREACEPGSIPEPPKKHTEVSWAAFLFGPNACAICQNKTFELPWSYVWRLHMCKKCSRPEVWKDHSIFCRAPTPSAEITAMLSQHNIPDSARFVRRCLPQDETSRWLAITGGYWMDPFSSAKVLKADSDKLIRQLNALLQLDHANQDVVLKRMTDRQRAVRKRYEDATRYLEWSTRLESSELERTRALKLGTESWADDNGIDCDSLQQANLYRQIRGGIVRQRLQPTVFRSLLEANKEELLEQATRIADRKEARLLNDIESKRRSAIDAYYTDSIVPAHRYRPSLKVFRTLPSIKSLIKDTNKTDIDNSLKSQVIRDLIKSDLEQWLERARNGVRRLLGYGDEKNKRNKGRANLKWRETEGKLAPEERPASLFTCTVCGRVEQRCAKMGVLDFEALCRHVCVKKDKASRDQPPWKIDNFRLDEKARDAVLQMMSISEDKIEEDDPEGSARLKEQDWDCLDCPPNMHRMTFEDMIRHAQRHKTLSIAPTGIDSSQPLSNRFSFADLIHNKEEAKKRQFACSHCYCHQGAGYALHSAAHKNTMDFNGMRSHMKAKHDIKDVRREDFYVVDDPHAIRKEESQENGRESSMEI